MTEALKCPECSAPLDPPAEGSRTLRCPYCHCTVLLKDAAIASTAADMHAGIGMAVGRALEMAQLNQYVRAGNKIAAIKIYRDCYGVDLKTAKAAVERLAAGQSPAPVVSTIPITPYSRALSIGLAFAVLGIVTTILVVLGLVVRVANTASPNQPAYVPPVINDLPAPTPVGPPPPAPPSFANQVLEFGSQGIGAGQFKDARSIALDGAGHIYVAEYSGGRVQVFDSSGKFLKTWSIGTKGVVSNIAANRDGTLIALVDGKILSFEGMTGRAFGEAAVTNGDTQEIYTDACYSLTGDIYALDSNSNIVVLSSTGQMKSTINAREKTGDDEVDFDKIAVNGNGQIYAIDHKKGIFQFAPDGHYLNRFGMSDDPDPTDTRPDTLHEALNLAIDGQGRIFVSDLNPAIKAYDSSGRFLGSIAPNEVCFGLAINDQNQIFACFRNANVVREYVLAKK